MGSGKEFLVSVMWGVRFSKPWGQFCQENLWSRVALMGGRALTAGAPLPLPETELENHVSAPNSSFEIFTYVLPS